jgi:hypothetical protein
LPFLEQQRGDATPAPTGPLKTANRPAAPEGASLKNNGYFLYAFTMAFSAMDMALSADIPLAQ